MSDYKLKQVPEDFVVREISSVKLIPSGKYAVFLLRKKNYTTEKAVQQVADSLHIERKRIGYAGSKDSKAVTEQSISIKGFGKNKVEALKLEDIELEFLGYTKEPISLGDLQGNSFEIFVRNIEQKPEPLSMIVNYFGEQRFSRNNSEIGKAIIKKDFRKAAEMITSSNGSEEKKAMAFLEKNKNDFVGALKQMPWKTLNMYIHAYQSKLWNETAKELVSIPAGVEAQLVNSKLVKSKKVNNKKNLLAAGATKLPLIGFATEIQDNDVNQIVEKILQNEDVKKEDFVIRAIPELSSAGNERNLFAEIKGLAIGKLENDELNPGKKKVRVAFSLGKGSYATEVIEELFS
jgi:tRNA pseudouridine13 synthase